MSQMGKMTQCGAIIFLDFFHHKDSKYSGCLSEDLFVGDKTRDAVSGISKAVN
jgi:hypothetical protein